MRLDEYILQKEFAANIEKARDFILAGTVLVNNATVRNKMYKVLKTDIVTILENNNYVSRGYEKLNFAMNAFSLNVAGEVALDIGASTGGFSQCLLNRDILKVYALDVGHNQLVYKLRKDSRVVSLENTNAKYMKREMFTPTPSIIVSDVSFISISQIAPVIRKELYDIKFWVSLIKPQFEADRFEVDVGGIIRDDNLREEIANRAIQRVVDAGFVFRNRVTSPIKGLKGNIEYLALFTI